MAFRFILLECFFMQSNQIVQNITFQNSWCSKQRSKQSHRSQTKYKVLVFPFLWLLIHFYVRQSLCISSTQSMLVKAHILCFLCRSKNTKIEYIMKYHLVQKSIQILVELRWHVIIGYKIQLVEIRWGKLTWLTKKSNKCDLELSIYLKTKFSFSK